MPQSNDSGLLSLTILLFMKNSVFYFNEVHHF